MTRKDYIAIAAAIADELNAWTQIKPEDNAELCQAGALTCGYIAQRLAVVLANDNPRFDRARFLQACGIPE